MKRLNDALRGLRSYAPALADGLRVEEYCLNPVCGICHNVGRYLYEANFKECIELDEDAREIYWEESDKLSEIMDQWPGRLPNSRAYPVGGPEEYHNSAGQPPGYLWRNPRRLALLDWLIKVTDHGN